MTFEAWLVLVVLVAVVAGMATERTPAAVVMLAGVAVLLALGVVDGRQAFSGFSNPAPITVAALYVLARGVEVTGAVDRVTAGLLPERLPEGGGRGELARMLAPTAAASAFLNNTPIVAMLGPQITAWARRTGRSASPYLMPVSFAAIVGGLVTVIGTSTNLVVSGLLLDSGMQPIGLFEIARVGLPIAVVVVTGLVLVGPVLVSGRRDPVEAVSDDAPEYSVEMIVEPDGPVHGRSVAESGLRNLRGVYLVEVERNGSRIGPVGPDQRLEGGDRLVFAGDVEQVVDLQNLAGLRAAEGHHFSLANGNPERRFYEAIVGEGSRLAGSTLKASAFRSRYDGAVVAIHRAGERVHEKLGEVPLRAGDLLLVLAQPAFQRRWREHHDFVVASPIEGSAVPHRTEKTWVVRLLLLGLLVTAGTGLVDILTASVLVGLVLVALRVLSWGEARDAVDVNVVVLIAASFGLGAAIADSGLATVLGAAITGGFGGYGDLGLLAGVLVTTIALTAIVSNNAAAVIMFPIAIATAAGAGLDPRPFAFALAVGASCGFLTPIGYQTNTMVYAMGGYRFGDFARLGTPFTLLVVVVSLVAIPLAWPLR